MLPANFHNELRILPRGGLAFGDHRKPPGGPLAVGEFVILRAELAWIVDAVAAKTAYEFVTCEVTSISGRRFCGEVSIMPAPEIIPPRLLRMGSPLMFTMDDVLTILPRRKRSAAN